MVRVYPRCFTCVSDAIKFVNEHVLTLHSLLMYLKPMVMVIEALFVTFPPGFESSKPGLDDGVDRTYPVDGTNILSPLVTSLLVSWTF